jgi:hypothetical protein
LTTGLGLGGLGGLCASMAAPQKAAAVFLKRLGENIEWTDFSLLPKMENQ